MVKLNIISPSPASNSFGGTQVFGMDFGTDDDDGDDRHFAATDKTTG